MKASRVAAVLLACLLSVIGLRAQELDSLTRQSLSDKLDEYLAAIEASGTEVQKEEADKNVTSTPSKYYGIQIMGLGRLLKNGDSALKGLQVQAVKAEGSSIYKYIYGKHATRSAAAAELPAVKKKFPEAFIVEVNGDSVKISK